MTEIQMVITTITNHVIEGIWEDTGGEDPSLAATGLAKTLSQGGAIGLFTDDGSVIIPARSVSHVRVRTRQT